MQIMIIGGTKFLGRHLVQSAIGAGHQVTTFNRGTTVLSEQDCVCKVTGNRDSDLSNLAGLKWDAIIDTCGYEPESVQLSCTQLKEQTNNYTFVSTISVYKDYAADKIGESHSLKDLENGDKKEYGSLKAACERMVQQAYPQNHLIVRPGLIVGPYDPTDRFTYWPARIARAGKVLAPGSPDRQVQIIDARDLADFIIKAVTNKTTGVYNATGPDYVLTMEQMLKQCQSTLDSQCQLVWWSDQDLIAAEVAPWSEMPLWVPQDDAELAGFLSIDNSQAIAAGLSFRKLAATIKDTYDWDKSRQSADYLAGISAEREARLLNQ